MEQIWENKTKLAKLEKNDGSKKIQAIIFKIKSTSLKFDNIKSFDDESILSKFLKKSKMHLTDKVLVVE